MIIDQAYLKTDEKNIAGYANRESGFAHPWTKNTLFVFDRGYELQKENPPPHEGYSILAHEIAHVTLGEPHNAEDGNILCGVFSCKGTEFTQRQCKKLTHKSSYEVICSNDRHVEKVLERVIYGWGLLETTDDSARTQKARYLEVRKNIKAFLENPQKHMAEDKTLVRKDVCSAVEKILPWLEDRGCKMGNGAKIDISVVKSYCDF